MGESDAIGRWYAEQAERARQKAAELREAKARGASYQEVRRLERELERVRNVGD